MILCAAGQVMQLAEQFYGGHTWRMLHSIPEESHAPKASDAPHTRLYMALIIHRLLELMIFELNGI